MKQVTVSVIVPVYNAEDFLERCLNSIVDQTLKDYEIILVNDGSTDKSGEICEKYKNKYSNISVLHKENGGGASEARNVGISHAKGEFICFVDNDDMLPDNYTLERMHEKATSIDADLIIGRKELYNFILSDKDYCQNFWGGAIVGKDFLVYMLKNNIYQGTVWSNLYKKTLIVNNGCFFTKGLINEDEEFFIKILYFAQRIGVLEVDCYKRGINDKSQTNKLDSFTYFRKAKDRIYVADSIYNFINEKEDDFIYKKPFYLRSIQFYLAALSINVNYLYGTEYFDVINEMLHSNIHIFKESKKIGLKYMFINLIYIMSFGNFTLLYSIMKKMR